MTDSITEKAEKAAGHDLGDKDYVHPKTRQMKRKSASFELTSLFSFALVAMSSWERTILSSGFSLANGGPLALLIGLAVSIIGSLAIAASIAEMASMLPSLSGQSYWVWKLSHKRVRKYLSFLSGILSFFGWSSVSALSFYSLVAIIYQLVRIAHAEFHPELYHSYPYTATAFGLLILFNVAFSKYYPRLVNFMMFCHITCFFSIMSYVIFLAKHTTPKFDAANRKVVSCWKDKPAAGWAAGMMGMVYPLVGFDAPVMLRDRVASGSPPEVLPIAIMRACIVNIAFSIIMAVGFICSIGENRAAVDAINQIPFIYMFQRGTGFDSQFTLGLTATICFCTLCATITALTASYQQTVALARNRAIPCARLFLWHYKKSPVRVVSVLPAALLCLPLVFTGFDRTSIPQNLVGITISTLYAAYLIPICSMIYHRRYSKVKITMGPWEIRPKYALATNIVAVIFIVFCLIFSAFPVGGRDNHTVRNTSPLVLAGILVSSSIWYGIYQRRRFKGVMGDHIKTVDEDQKT